MGGFLNKSIRKPIIIPPIKPIIEAIITSSIAYSISHTFHTCRVLTGGVQYIWWNLEEVRYVVGFSRQLQEPHRVHNLADFFMTTKQANLITLLNTLESLIEDTFGNIPQDLIQTLIDIENYIRNTDPKD